MNGLRPAATVTLLFGVVVLVLLGFLPFWLDEVLQLIGTQPAATWHEVVRYVPQNPGGVPLGYLVQHAFLALVGLTRFTARIPAALFGIASVWLVALLGRRLSICRPWMAAAIFAILPISLRYATEGRPYSQAIFLSLAGLFTGFRLGESPSPARAAVHALLVAAGLYTQPFTIFVPAAQVAWLAWRGLWRPAGFVGVAVAAAVLSFLPWMVYARGDWSHTITASQFQFVFTPRTPLMLLRELTGAGYAGAGCLLVAAYLGWCSTTLSRDTKVLLTLIVALCFAGGLAADAAFGYFIAIRQFLWALPALALLAGEGLASTSGLGRVALLAVLLGAAAAASYRHFASPRENWEAAAETVAASLGPTGCADVVGPDQAVFYEFFRPDLKSRKCQDSPLRRVKVITPYAPSGQAGEPGYALTSDQTVGGTRILVLERRP